MRILRAADRIASPWKNGGGVTREVMAWPPDADIHRFEWRLSLAGVTADGPFSTFPGVDRVLTVVEGQGFTLQLPGETVLLEMGSRLAFPGEATVTGRLSAGPIRDFNVMVRRDLWRAEVSWSGGGTLAADFGGPAFALALGAGAVVHDGLKYDLGRFDVLHLDPGETAVLERPSPPGAVIVNLHALAGGV